MILTAIERVGPSIGMGNVPCPNRHPKASITRIMPDARNLNNVPEDDVEKQEDQWWDLGLDTEEEIQT